MTALFGNEHEKKILKNWLLSEHQPSIQLTITMNLQAHNGTKNDDFLSLKLFEVTAFVCDKWQTDLGIIEYKSYNQQSILSQ